MIDSNSCHLSGISPNVVNFMSVVASSQRLIKQANDSRIAADELVRKVSCVEMQFSESEHHKDYDNSSQPKSSLVKQRNA